MSRLTAGFMARPFAHRGLHDDERSENGMAAILAAAGAGYGIECDIQPRGDGTPMVFHDYDLKRLTGEEGRIAETPAPALAGMRLRSGEPIPTLAEVLEAVAGRVPILVEIKDQDGAFGPDVGPLDREVATLCTAYCARHGADALAVMSFNPHSVGWFAKHAPELRRGLVSYDYADEELDEGYRARLADCAFFDEVGADFVSYGATSFPSTAVAALRARGVPILTWTIRSEAAAEAALAHCDQITFENYRPDPRS